ncbi:MAG: hypothetical protein AAF184_14225 [Pseudomonadota bacterium]
MTQIDVTLSDELQEALRQPLCADLSLPKPGSVSLALPSGGTLKGIADATRAIPTDCTLSINLLMQLGPILANLDCIIKLLKLVEPLIDIVKGLPFPPVEAVKKFIEAAPPVVECIVALTGAGIIPFIRDILCLVIKIMRCLIDQLNTLISLLGRIELDLAEAQASGNTAALAGIECARENAMCAANASFQSIEPVMLIMELVAPLFEFTPIDAIALPSLAAPEDVESMQTLVTTLETFVDAAQIAADALGGCE